MSRPPVHASRTITAIVVATASLAACDRGAVPHKNAEYSIGGRSVRLVDGVADEPAAPGSTARLVTRYFGSEAWGDLNRDGREDVAFVLTQETGGSGTFFYAVAALDLERGFAGSQALLLGDRIAPQSTVVQPDGTIVIAFADRAPGESFSTPPSIAKSIQLKLNPATLQLAELVQDFEGEADPDSMKLDMKTWTWIRAVDNGIEVVPRQADAFTLAFRADGTFAATTDCNRIRGGYSAQSSELTFAETMAATRMFCADSQEMVFTAILATATSYSFTPRGELVLQLAGNAGFMIFR